MKRHETKKILAVIIILIGIVWVSVSYILAWLNVYNTNESISSAVVYSIIGTYLSYCLASYAEKNSRNKYDIDENGNKRGGERGD